MKGQAGLTNEELRGPGKGKVCLRINEADYEVFIEPRTTLLDVLRDYLGFTGTKKVCDNGECGSCSIIIDGSLVYSCLTLAVECEGKEILTIEGLSEQDTLHPIQRAFIEHDGFQCGFCTAGQVMAVKNLLDRNQNPSLDDVKRGVSGNLCRCGAYPKIFNAAMKAAEYIRHRKNQGDKQWQKS